VGAFWLPKVVHQNREKERKKERKKKGRNLSVCKMKGKIVI